jgi:glycosyltransferase involved in cell wall biosynthesis
MRIVHVTDCFMPRMGGIERQVHDLAARQQAAGHTVDIVTAVAQTEDTVTDLGAVRVLRPPAGRGRPSAVHYSRYRTGGPQVLAGNYDVVHAHVSTMSPLAYHAAQSASRAGMPTVVTVHSLWHTSGPIFHAFDLALKWSKWPIAWSAVSSVAAHHLIRQLGPGVDVAILPNAVDRDAWRIESLPRKDNRVVIASVMRLAARKRPHQYLAMLRRARGLVPEHIAMEAVIMGDGPRRPGLERYLSRHNMDWVRLAGRVTHEEIRTAYRDADFFVAPATLESFGIAALEARSAGLPIIAQSVSGVRDFVTHGSEGLLADGDRDMADRIAQLTMSPRMRATMRRRNTTHAPAFGWPEVLAECDRLYLRAGAPPDILGLVANDAPLDSDADFTEAARYA